ncbi:MAG: hypothetical protein RJB66_1394 [Pseudomonadota bacterium]
METARSSIRSLISLILVIGTLFTVAFLQMEERRENYEVLKLNRDLKKAIESRRSLEIQRLTALRPQKIEKELKNRANFNRAGSDQIIHLPTYGSPLNAATMAGVGL